MSAIHGVTELWIGWRGRGVRWFLQMIKRPTWTVALLVTMGGARWLAGCGSDPVSQFNPNDVDAAAGDGTPPTPAYDQVVVEPAQVTLPVPLGGTAHQTYKAFGVKGGVRSEITTACGFGTTDPSFGLFNGPTFDAAARGGATQVAANCSGVVGTSELTLVLTGDVVATGAPANAPQLFAGAQLGADAARKPVVEYPIAASVLPLNIPPINVQWRASTSDLFRATFKSAHADLRIFTNAFDAEFTKALWATVAQSTAGDVVTVSVSGLLASDPTMRFESEPVDVRMSRDRIDETSIYFWASSKQSLLTQTFGATDPPAKVRDNCTSCHSVSRAGTRIGYSRCVGNDCGAASMAVGFMRYDAVAKTWNDTVNADTKSILGTYTTFAPKGYPYAGDEKAIALVTSNGALRLYDPDTGVAIASTAETASLKAADGTPTRNAMMADWSPDGRTIVYASVPTGSNGVDLATGQLATMAYALNGATHVFGDPHFILKDPIVLPSGTYNNFFFPSFAPDGNLIVFNAAREAWRNFQTASQPGQRLMLTDKDGSTTVELANLNGGADRNVTWPHWAPSASTDYLWIVFSSERDYGHKSTAANAAAACKSNGVKQCKQIWIAAIDKTKVFAHGQASPIDPSAPPVWLPGQDLDADNISPYWTLPPTAAVK